MHGKTIIPPNIPSEDRMLTLAQSGDSRAVEYLVTEYPPLRSLIASLMRLVDPTNLADDELEAAARLAVLEALHGYDPQRGARFTTYAYHFIRGAMLKALYPHVERRRDAEHDPQRIKFVSADAAEDAESPGRGDYERELLRNDPSYGTDPGYARVEDRPRDTAVRAFVRSLPENQRAITEDVFWGERTHADVAAERGISRPAVTRTLQRVFVRGQQELADFRLGIAT